MANASSAEASTLAAECTPSAAQSTTQVTVVAKATCRAKGFALLIAPRSAVAGLGRRADRQTRSIHSRAEPRTGLPLSWPAAPPRFARGSAIALEVLRAEILKIEEVAEKLSRATSDDDRVGLSNALQACSKVRRLAYDCLLLRSARAYQVADDNQSGRDADARLEGRVGLQATYCGDQLQSRADCPLCVVLVGLRIAEVNQNPVAYVLRPALTAALSPWTVAPQSPQLTPHQFFYTAGRGGDPDLRRPDPIGARAPARRFSSVAVF
jgi:hypothetical protein